VDRLARAPASLMELGVVDGWCTRHHRTHRTTAVPDGWVGH